MIANILLGLNLYEYKEWWYETNPDYEFLVISEKEEDVLMHYNPIENEAEKFELKEIGEVYFTSDLEDKIVNAVLQKYPIAKIIRGRFLEDMQFLRYFRSLFSDLYDEMKGIEIYIEDFAELNKAKDVLYEKVPKSRLEFLMYLKSVIDFMIQEEKTEAEENNISMN